MKKYILFFLILMIFSSRASGDSNIKEPNVAGQFYSADPKALLRELDEFFSQSPVISSDKKIRVLIAPHAGYIYSGVVAANSYKAAGRGQYSTIVLIGPSHFFDFPGISIWNKGDFRTPLGEIPVDEKFADDLIKSNPQFGFRPEVYEQEHSLEVQMPFLQKTFKDFKIVPILMGRPDYQVCEGLAESLKQLIGDRDDILIAISTDMSHYHTGDAARSMDQKTLEIIKDLNPQALWTQCLLRKSELCGFTSVVTGLLYANRQNIKDVEVLKYAHSGDVTGDNSRVVGYSAIVFRGNKSPADDSLQLTAVDSTQNSLTPDQKKRLLQIARETIKAYLETGKTLEISEKDPRLLKNEGAFVTLRKNGTLRGCIGQIIGREPLYLTVRDMAISAATQDPRFKPVDKEEFKDIEVEISVLSAPKVIRDVQEIQMGTHGVIIHRGPYHHGVFLPQVATETGWSREEFLSELCSQKAGLPTECWKDPSTTIEIFTADVFEEKNLR